MGKQVRFLVVKEDLDQLLQFAEQKGFKALPAAIETETDPVAQCPTAVNVPPSTDFFYLLPQEFAVVEAFYNELPYEPGWSKLIAHSSPVIEVSPVAVAADEPVEGRIYICDDSCDPRYDTAMKAYDKLARFLKKWIKTKDGRLYIGPRTAALILSGKIPPQ